MFDIKEKKAKQTNAKKFIFLLNLFKYNQNNAKTIKLVVEAWIQEANKDAESEKYIFKFQFPASFD